MFVNLLIQYLIPSVPTPAYTFGCCSFFFFASAIGKLLFFSGGGEGTLFVSVNVFAAKFHTMERFTHKEEIWGGVASVRRVVCLMTSVDI